MRLSNTPPKGAGEVHGVTKTERLLRHIEGLGLDKVTFLPIGIRVAALEKATGVPAASISALLTPHVKSGRISMCKITIPGKSPQNEYRKGSGVPPPEFTPLKIRRAGAPGGAAHRGGTAAAPPLSTPAPSAHDIETPTLTRTQQPQPAVGNTGSAQSSPISPEVRAVTSDPETPAPDAGAVLKEEPATPTAPAGDDLAITLDHKGTLTIAAGERVIELQIKNTQRLGHFLVGSQGVWNPF